MAIAIGYNSQSGGRSYNLVFRDFTSTDIPRSFDNTAGFNRSQTGALIQQGPRFTQKYVYTIDCMVETQVAEDLEQLYADWDTDRASGRSVAVGLVDTCFGATKELTVTFSVAPTFTYAGPRHTIVSFGLQQV